MTMKLQIASDLHIEFKNDDIPDPLNYITPSAEILVLAGDIGTFYKYDQLYGFLNRLSEYFERIVYVLGNHEYYQQENTEPMTIECIKQYTKKLEESIKNLSILDRSGIHVKNTDICIIGCTLWSRLEPDKKLPRYFRCHNMTTSLYNKMHNNDLRYIQEMIEYCKSKNLRLVVVTHYLPSYRVIPSRKMSHSNVSMYASNLDYMFDGSLIHTWICGHIHSNFNTTVNGTHIVSNQKGKPRDRITDYDKSFVITI